MVSNEEKESKVIIIIRMIKGNIKIVIVIWVIKRVFSKLDVRVQTGIFVVKTPGC